MFETKNACEHLCSIILSFEPPKQNNMSHTKMAHKTYTAYRPRNVESGRAVFLLMVQSSFSRVLVLKSVWPIKGEKLFLPNGWFKWWAYAHKPCIHILCIRPKCRIWTGCLSWFNSLLQVCTQHRCAIYQWHTTFFVTGFIQKCFFRVKMAYRHHSACAI